MSKHLFCSEFYVQIIVMGKLSVAKNKNVSIFYGVLYNYIEMSEQIKFFNEKIRIASQWMTGFFLN